MPATLDQIRDSYEALPASPGADRALADELDSIYARLSELDREFGQNSETYTRLEERAARIEAQLTKENPS